MDVLLSKKHGVFSPSGVQNSKANIKMFKTGKSTDRKI